ncbi:MAG: formylglycine-generating enzyme family protein, partial [Sediminibacterium sp.]|nr:formylglycine-generating enzyme family protein [Sediminibacterium sp.]
YNTPVYRNFNILLYESIFHTSEYLNNSEATNNLVTFTDYEKTKKSYNDKSLTSLFYNELMKFKSPFIGLFQLAGEIGNSNFIRWFKGPGHVVVFYRYKKNNDGTGRFYYYDNNIPGEELFITHNKDGSFPNNVLASLSSTKEPFKIAKYGTISLGQYDIQTVLNLMGSNFVPLYFNVTTSIDYGTISPSKQIRQGDIYTINYSINSNRVLDYIEYSDGIYVYPLRYYSTNFNTIKITENSFTIKVYKDYYVKVFTKPKPQINQYTLTTSITNGSISPTIAIDAASNYTITFTANSGYLINSVYINGQKYIGSSLGLGSSRGSYTFNNIKANATIAVYCTAKNDPYDPTLTTLTLANLEANMVTLPGGTFTMGATPKQISDGFSPWWSPTTQQVTLSTYKICKFEVTQQLWLAVMGSNPSYFTGNLQRPVEQVSWDDCQAFITKLNQLTGKNYRLPTEAEWEYAARGGNNNDSYIFSGSNNLDAVAWYVSNSGNTTHTVGTKQANQLGLYDMSGNVWEWCSDWYGNYSGSAVTNPTGPISGTFRVSRGGSWNGGGYNYRVSTRYSGYPYTRSYSVGLRLVSAP